MKTSELSYTSSYGPGRFCQFRILHRQAPGSCMVRHFDLAWAGTLSLHRQAPRPCAGKHLDPAKAGPGHTQAPVSCRILPVCRHLASVQAGTWTLHRQDLGLASTWTLHRQHLDSAVTWDLHRQATGPRLDLNSGTLNDQRLNSHIGPEWRSAPRSGVAKHCAKSSVILGKIKSQCSH